MVLVWLTAGCGGLEHNSSGPVVDASPTPDGETADATVPDALMIPDANRLGPGPDEVQVTVPLDDEIVVSDRITVGCHAVPDAVTESPVDAVAFLIRDAAGGMVTAVGTADSETEWSASVNLGAMSNGVLTVRCEATASDGESADDTSIAYIDLGPRITVHRPATGDAVHGNIYVDFEVDPWKVTPEDDMAGVVTVAASIAGEAIELTDEGGGRYTAVVRADDPLLFVPALAGANTFRVDATNERGVLRELRTIFIVDNDGPIVEIEQPEPGDLIGGIVSVVASVEDAAGVDEDTVVAVIGNGPVDLADFPLTLRSDGKYEGSYDTRELRQIVEAIYGDSIQLVLPTLSVRAHDLPGNEGSVGRVQALDYTPPQASLDPPRIREAIVAPEEMACSWLFDPLGDDSTNDRQSVGQLSEFRARVEDRGNFGVPTSTVVVPKAGVASVTLYVLDNTDEGEGAAGDALLVDTDGDALHRCDDVNPMLTPTTTPATATDALAIDLAPISPTGTAYFDYDPAPEPDYVAAGCSFNPVFVPDAICPYSSGLQRVITEQLEFGGAVIWGIPPFSTSVCLGQAFDSIANHISDGWACVAVRSVDKLGNVSVSRPLRVCFDHDFDGAEGCPGQPSYPFGPDVTTNKADAPVIPVADPSDVPDCTGRYTRPTATTPESTDADADCTLPDEYPVGEIRRL